MDNRIAFQLGLIVGYDIICFIFLFVLAIYSACKNKLYEEFLRKNKLLNIFADYEHDKGQAIKNKFLSLFKKRGRKNVKRF